MTDLTLDPAPFADNAPDPKTLALNETLHQMGNAVQPWWEMGAPAAREARETGKSVFPKPVYLPQGVKGAVPSRDAGREIPTRILPPTEGESKGVYVHYHGGGWVLSHEGSQDPTLAWIANNLHVTVVSIGYRLAPEDPFPAGPNDCYDAADYLVDNARRLFDGDVLYMGGESAGGHLSMLSMLHLLRSRPKFALKALFLNYGVFNLSTPLPSGINIDRTIVLSPLLVEKFIEAATPGLTSVQRCDPAISPLYADLPKLLKASGQKHLPPAFFDVGTEDCLLDDTLLMAMKYRSTGSTAAVKIYPGGPHGFSAMHADQCPLVEDWRRDLKAFVERL